MGQEGDSAAVRLTRAHEGVIPDVWYHDGDERQSRGVARAIVAARPLSRTGELAAVIRKALRHPPGAPKDPATKSFQAIRLHIHGALDQLKAGLDAAEKLMRPGGRPVLARFHRHKDGRSKPVGPKNVG